jgi:PKD repeat protein
MKHTRKTLWSPLGLLAVSLTLAACSAPGGDAGTPGTLTLDLRADTRRGEVPLVVNFTATPEPATAGLSYRWDFGAGAASIGSRSRPYVYTEPGRYTVSAEVVGGGASARNEVTVEVAESSRPRDPNNQPPTVSLTAAPDPADPYVVSFAATAEDPNSNDTLSYTLDFGDGARAARSSASHTYDAPGRYLATVVVTDGRGGAATAEVEVVLE